MDAVDTVARFGFSRIPAADYGGRHVIVLAAEAVQEIRRVVAEAEAAAADIRANPALTEEGRAAELARLGEGELARLDYGKLLQALEAERERLRAALATATREPDDAARAVRETQVQERLAAMDAAERAAAFQEAIERGERLVFEAVRNAPTFLDLVPADVLAAGEAAWAAKTAPEQARALADVEATLDELERTLAAARRELAALTGAGEADAVEQAAANGGEAEPQSSAADAA